MADYVYRGNQPWNPNAPVKDSFHLSAAGRPLKPCGTPAAYRRHLAKSETPFEPCATAYRERREAYKAARKARKKAEKQ